VRLPSVAGYFYPNDPAEIRSLLSSFQRKIQPRSIPGRIIGAVVPHAGYIYSGLTAMHAYMAILGKTGNRPLRFLVVGPSHQGYPIYPAVYSSGSWVTPMGVAEIDSDLGRKLLSKSGIARPDHDGHEGEHSIEVQIPILQYLFDGNFKFLPVQLGDQGMRVAEKLAGEILKLEEDFILIASSDLNHYEPQEITNQKDDALISRVTSLDTDGFYRTLADVGVSACGYGAISVLMYVTRKLKGRMVLIHHSTSGEVNRDFRSVVGYSAIIAYLPDQ